MKNFDLEFDGYYIYEKKDVMPARAGIYCVYAGTFDKENNSCYLRELVYIGESVNICERLFNHEAEEDWRMCLRPGETMLFSCAPLGAADRERAEAALIYRHKPCCNTEHVDNFSYAETIVYASGENEHLSPITIAK